MRSEPNVWIQIVTWNNSEDLIATLDNLNNLDYPKQYLQVLVLDNGSTDGTKDKVESLFAAMASNGWANLKLHNAEVNLGAFGGRAEAAKFLPDNTEYLLVLDDDVELAPDALRTMLSALEETEAAAVGGRIVYFQHPDSTAVGAGYFNPWLGLISGKTLVERGECDFIPTCGALFRKDIFNEVGGFDREFYTSFGDVDICLRIKKAGYRIIYEPKALIKHKVQIGGTRSPERIYYLYRNKILLFRKHLSWLQWVSVAALYGIFWVPKLIISSLIFHRGINKPELRSILFGVRDAILNQRGKADVTFKDST